MLFRSWSVVQNIVDLCICTILYWAAGWSFAYGNEEHALQSIIGRGDFFLDSDDVPAQWLFQVSGPRLALGPLSRLITRVPCSQMGFAANTVTLSSGMLAERAQYWCYFFTTMCLGGLVYPIMAHCE